MSLDPRTWGDWKVGGGGYFYNIAHTLLIFNSNLDQLFIKNLCAFWSTIITFFPDLPFHTKPMLNKLYLQLRRLILCCLVILSVCFQPRRYCRWHGCLIACRLHCSNYRWYHDIAKVFYFFFAKWIDYLCCFRNYVAFSTVSLITNIRHLVESSAENIVTFPFHKKWICWRNFHDIGPSTCFRYHSPSPRLDWYLNPWWILCGNNIDWWKKEAFI